jgi:hypothetical protein
LSFHCGFFLLNVETSERVVSFISIASKRDMSVILTLHEAPTTR